MEQVATSWGNTFELPNCGLRAYFSRVVSGQPKVYRTTFFKDRSLASILDDWFSQLEPELSRWPELLSFEREMKDKAGPLSVMKPLKDRMTDIDAYYTSVTKPSIPIPDVAVNATKEWLRALKGMRLRSQAHTVERMQKSTNSGAPYFTKRRTVIDDTIPCSISGNQQILPNGTFDLAAVLGWRGQEGGPSADDVKQRVVWMFPFGVNICELQFYQPFIEACQRTGVMAPWISMDAVDTNITKLFDSLDGDKIICTDFSKFDQHFNSDMQNCCKEVFRWLLDDTSGWLDNVFPVKYNIPLAYNWNRIRTGDHGMGSGSGGTNADESVSHKALQFEAAITANAQLNPYSMDLGDDGILSYKGINVDHVVETYSSHGQEMNVSKQYVSDHDCVFLRRWHHTDYRIDGIARGVYATCRALGRLCMQERYYDPKVWGPKMVALRQISILENVKWHPVREKFVDYCMKGDKFRLGIDIPGFLDNIESEAKQATSYMPDFLGYTKTQMREESQSTGIDNWWIVNYLRSKS